MVATDLIQSDRQISQRDDRGLRRGGNELAETVEQSSEIGTSHSTMLARAEIEGAIIIARRFPRNEDKCFGDIAKSCARLRFAENVCYRYPRGGQDVVGLSVYFAKEAARIWGNIRYGFNVTNDTETERTICCWAWDVQTNTKTQYEASFAKLVQRKDKHTKRTEWVEPDERDLRELTGNIASRLVRNAILDLLPEDFKRDGEDFANDTLRKNVAADPEAHKKSMILSFSGLGIDVNQLELYLGHSLGIATPTEISNLRQVYKSVKDGHTTWTQHIAETDEQPQSKTPPAAGTTAGALADPKKGEPSGKRRNAKTETQPAAKTEAAADNAGSTGLELFDQICERVSECESLVDLGNEEADFHSVRDQMEPRHANELQAVIDTKRRELEQA